MKHQGKIRVCQCEQCKASKNSRKNRRAKHRIKRLLNKRMRKSKDGIVETYYWN